MLFGKDYFKKENVPMPDSFSKVIITTKDDIRLEGWYGQASNAKGSVALFHGYGDNKSKVLTRGHGFFKYGL